MATQNRRKTIEVRTLISRLNGMLAANISEEKREAICHVAETVLFDTNNYKGFMYMTGPEQPETLDRIQAGEHDEFRRRYFIPLDD